MDRIIWKTQNTMYIKPHMNIQNKITSEIMVARKKTRKSDKVQNLAFQTHDAKI